MLKGAPTAANFRELAQTAEEKIMAKLCPRGKAAAKRKFKVYPSAYANMYASAVCSGKVTPGGKKRAKKAMGGTANPRQMYGKVVFVREEKAELTERIRNG